MQRRWGWEPISPTKRRNEKLTEANCLYFVRKRSSFFVVTMDAGKMQGGIYRSGVHLVAAPVRQDDLAGQSRQSIVVFLSATSRLPNFIFTFILPSKTLFALLPFFTTAFLTTFSLIPKSGRKARGRRWRSEISVQTGRLGPVIWTRLDRCSCQSFFEKETTNVWQNACQQPSQCL